VNGDTGKYMESRGKYVRYRWIGRPGQFVMGIPARDLTAEDLLRLEEAQGSRRSGCGCAGCTSRWSWRRWSRSAGLDWETGDGAGDG